MDTSFLETFLLVARRGSLVGAAQQQGMTANAVAQRLKALEAEFGVPLVERTGRTVRPTEAGNAVLARSEAFLSELQSLKAAVAGQAIEGELRVGAIGTVLTGMIPDVLEALAQKHTGLRIYLEPGASRQLCRRTLLGTLDAAAIIRPDFELPKTVTFHHWRRDPLVLMTPPDEPLTDVCEILSVRPVILYDRRQWGGQLAESWLKEQDIRMDIRFELDALDAIAVLVSRGLGVSVVPDWIGPWPEGTKVRRLSLPDDAPQREIGILAARNSARAHLLNAFVEAIAETSAPHIRAPV